MGSWTVWFSGGRTAAGRSPMSKPDLSKVAWSAARKGKRAFDAAVSDFFHGKELVLRNERPPSSLRTGRSFQITSTTTEQNIDLVYHFRLKSIAILTHCIQNLASLLFIKRLCINALRKVFDILHVSKVSVSL